MASPQVERGHTRIANEILEHIIKTDLNGTQFRILMAIWRYTYGYRRKEYEFTLSFLASSMETVKSHVGRELKELIDRKIVIVVGNGPRRGRILSFNKNYEEWSDKAPEPKKKEPVKKTEKPKQQKKAKYDDNSSYYKMALYFHKLVSDVAKEAQVEHLIKKANLQSWANDFRLLVEKDGVSKRLAKDVMDWVTKDPFWRTNVLSAKKLREKFPDLAIKMAAAQKPKVANQPQQKPNAMDKEIAFSKWVQEGNDPNDFDWS